MRILDCVQGTAGWHAARLGIPTASEFHKIITAARGELSRSAPKYAHQLVAEALLGEPLDAAVGGLPWLLRGRELEPQAVRQYEFTTDLETRAVGFVTTDCGRMGYSPDRLVLGATAAVEVKCLAPANHMGLVIDGPGEDYRQQVQGGLLIAELDWIDLYGYHPGLPPALVRTYRDEAYIGRLRAALDQFCDLKDAMLERVRAAGFFAAAAGQVVAA